MKRIIVFLLAACMMFGIVGCATNANGDVGGQSPSGNQATVEKPISAQSKEPESALPVRENDVLVQIEKALNEAGIEFEKVVMAAEMVGAESGMKFKTDAGQVEIYRFEEDSDALRRALDGQELTIEGFGAVPADVFGEYAVVNDVSGDEGVEISDIINNILK